MSRGGTPEVSECGRVIPGSLIKDGLTLCLESLDLVQHRQCSDGIAYPTLSGQPIDERNERIEGPIGFPNPIQVEAGFKIVVPETRSPSPHLEPVAGPTMALFKQLSSFIGWEAVQRPPGNARMNFQ